MGTNINHQKFFFVQKLFVKIDTLLHMFEPIFEALFPLYIFENIHSEY